MKFLSFLMFGLLLACSDGDPIPNLRAETYVSAGDYNYSEDDLIVDEATVQSFIVSEAVPETEQKVIKNAQLEFATKDPDATHKKVLILAKKAKGFIEKDNSGKDYGKVYRRVTVRVPTQNFQAFVDGLSEGVPYFDVKRISRRDVTEEFVDLEARLKTKKELEKRYLELLTKAKNVKEMLEIERELSSVREEIEAKQGRLNYLQNKVSLSTVNLEFYKTTAETGATVSYGQKIKNALQGGWNGVSIFFLGLLYIWPLFLIIIIIILVIRRLLKKKKSSN